jgi:hypothetical protein
LRITIKIASVNAVAAVVQNLYMVIGSENDSSWTDGLGGGLGTYDAFWP